MAAEDKTIGGLDPNPFLTGAEEKAVERDGANFRQSLNQEKDFFQANLDFGKIVTGFPTVQTGNFTVADDSDGKYQDCNFTVEREVTLNLTSFTEEGKSVYFEVLGAGQIKFIAGTGINSIQQNSLQSDVVGSIGDLIEIMLKPNGILKII